MNRMMIVFKVTNGMNINARFWGMTWVYIGI